MIVNKKRLDYSILLFLLAMTIRYIWACFSGVDNFSGPDWERYDIQSNEILKGNFNLETQLFITAPLFSYIVAGIKYIFKDNYTIVLEFIQILLSSIAVVFLAMTARILFNDKRMMIFTGVCFAFYPITLFWVHQFSQETFFQSLLIICIYFFTSYFKDRRYSNLWIASILFALALLTKSHIQITIPLLIIGLAITATSIRNALVEACIVTGSIFLITLPYGLYNQITNGTYVISSSGGGGFFLTGHNEDVYTYIVNPPPLGSKEHDRLHRMDFTVFRNLEKQSTGLTHSEKQRLYFQTGLSWVLENPEKAFHLAIVNFINFIKPGFHRENQPYNRWIISFLLSLPVFILAYFEIFRRLREDWRQHIPVVSLFLTMLIFSVLFYSQNRFRVITLEPFYLMYACSGLFFVIKNIKKRIYWLSKKEQFQ